jgi:hypothetical protein
VDVGGVEHLRRAATAATQGQVYSVDVTFHGTCRICATSGAEQ